MQNTTVVKDHTLAGLHLTLVDSTIHLGQVSKDLCSFVPIPHVPSKKGGTTSAVERCLEGGRPVDSVQLLPHSGVILFDVFGEALGYFKGAAALKVMMVVIVVMVVDLHVEEILEAFKIHLVHGFGSLIRVAEEGNATFSRSSETVEKLHPRRLLHVEKVHVEAEMNVSVSHVLCVGHTADVPSVAIKRIFQGADTIGSLNDAGLVFWNTREEHKTKNVEPA